ncbi:hypothetical protein [Nitrosomonas cryotolerans]|nr:hypothetical protein [Nitrosomonas cryotolerans]
MFEPAKAFRKNAAKLAKDQRGLSRQDEVSKPKRASISRFSMRAEVNSAASWNRSKRGVAVMCLPSIRVTQTGRARPAAICLPRIAQRNPSSRVSNVSTQKMQPSTWPSIF